jgi:hypothetical protein
VKSRSVVTEFGVFCLILGAGLAAFGFVLKSTTPPRAPPLWGMDRGVAIGIPIIVIGLLHIAAGAATLWKRSKSAIVAGMIASALIPLFYVGFMISATGNVGVNCIGFVMIAVPIIAFSRGKVALRELRAAARL